MSVRPGSCFVMGCKSSTTDLLQHRRQQCPIHASTQHRDCPCPALYTMYRFPSDKHVIGSKVRLKWATIINRRDINVELKNPGEKKLVLPGSGKSNSNMICSKHFTSTEPSSLDDDPELNLGYIGPDAELYRKLCYDESLIRVVSTDDVRNDGNSAPLLVNMQRRRRKVRNYFNECVYLMGYIVSFHIMWNLVYFLNSFVNLTSIAPVQKSV